MHKGLAATLEHWVLVLGFDPGRRFLVKDRHEGK